MKRLLFPLFIVIGIIIIVFVGLPGLEETFSTLITNSANRTKSYFAFISFSLLALDVFLPIPSSIVMFFNGSVLGLFLGGLLSLISSLVSAIIGFYFGKVFYHKVNKSYRPEELAKAEFVLQNYGFAGIIATRGIPILSEAISILSGNLNYTFKKFWLASFIGFLPISFLYAFIGSRSLDSGSFLWAFVINVLIAAVFLGMNLLERKTAK